jgi:predicted branched-subunit amino acid permease
LEQAAPKQIEAAPSTTFEPALYTFYVNPKSILLSISYTSKHFHTTARLRFDILLFLLLWMS